MLEALVSLLRKRQPLEGWLLWVLGLTALLLLPIAADDAAWVPHLGLALAVVVLFGYWAGFGLTRRQVKAEALVAQADAVDLPGWLAAIVLAVLGLLTVSVVVGWREAPAVPEAVPWLWRLPVHLGLASVEMVERVGQWSRSIRAGGAGQDDAVFRWVLGLAVWGAAAWAGWWLYARRRTLAALLPAGVLLALNAYYHWEGRIWLPFFLGLWAVIAVLANRFALELRWRRQGMDYSLDVRSDLLLMALAIGMLVTTGAFFMPRAVIGPTAQWFEELTAAPFDKLGATGRQLFPGLRRSAQPLLAEGGSPGGMPRSFLLGSGPELSHEVVMRVSSDELAGLAPGESPPPEMLHVWRALTYDRYSGRGWSNSALEQEEFGAGSAWFEESLQWRRPVRQRVELERSGNRALFAAGEPLAVNRPYRSLVRTPSSMPSSDLAALTGSGKRYEIVSLVPAASEEVVAAAGSRYPPEVVERYLQLPSMPVRVAELARRVAAGAETPYDQALALERYLRRYTYDLAVAPAPPGRDAVDYFLFDARAGYCDSFASAMVVMARSLGIPARLAVGYASGDYDPGSGAFVVHGDDAHSWPELYFPELGWLPFEPTATRVAVALGGSPEARPQLEAEVQAQIEADLGAFRAERAARRRLAWTLGLALLGLAAGAAAVAWRRRPQPPLEQSYARLGRWGRRLGRPAGAGETAGEFGRGLSGQVQAIDAGRGAEAAAGVLAYVERFEAAQYGPTSEAAAEDARRHWPGLVRVLRRVWLRRLVGRGRPAPGE